MDLSESQHDFILIFLGSGLILGSLGVVYFTNPIFPAFPLGLVLICVSLFYILSNSHCGHYKCFNNICYDVYEWFRLLPKFCVCTVGDGITLMVCTSIFLSQITTILETLWHKIIWTTRPNQILEQDLISTSQQIEFIYQQFFSSI